MRGPSIRVPARPSCRRRGGRDSESVALARRRGRGPSLKGHSLFPARGPIPRHDMMVCGSGGPRARRAWLRDVEGRGSGCDPPARVDGRVQRGWRCSAIPALLNAFPACPTTSTPIAAARASSRSMPLMVSAASLRRQQHEPLRRGQGRGCFLVSAATRDASPQATPLRNRFFGLAQKQRAGLCWACRAQHLFPQSLLPPPLSGPRVGRAERRQKKKPAPGPSRGAPGAAHFVLTRRQRSTRGHGGGAEAGQQPGSFQPGAGRMARRECRPSAPRPVVLRAFL